MHFKAYAIAVKFENLFNDVFIGE